MQVPCRRECPLKQLPEQVQPPAIEVVGQEGRSLRELVNNDLGPLAVRQVEVGRALTDSEARRIVFDCVAQCPQFQPDRVN